MKEIIRRLETNPVIATVRELPAVEEAEYSQAEIVFLLCGDIFNIQELVERLHQRGKMVFIHMDLLGGIGRDAKAVEYVARVIRPDGIISTRSQLIRLAREQGLSTVQRFFLLDSQSVAVTVETANAVRPDLAEIMPGLIPSVIRQMTKSLKCPVIAGGMLTRKEELIEAIKAGAAGTSTSRAELWE